MPEPVWLNYSGLTPDDVEECVDEVLVELNFDLGLDPDDCYAAPELARRAGELRVYERLAELRAVWRTLEVGEVERRLRTIHFDVRRLWILLDRLCEQEMRRMAVRDAAEAAELERGIATVRAAGLAGDLIDEAEARAVDLRLGQRRLVHDARRRRRQAQASSRQLRRERQAHEAWLIGLAPSSGRLRLPARRRGGHGRPRSRPRRTRGPPAGDDDCDPGDPDHVGRRRRQGRAP